MKDELKDTDYLIVDEIESFVKVLDSVIPKK